MSRPSIRLCLFAALAPSLGLIALPASAASLVLSGNYCSVAPISNPLPGLNLNGLANQTASLNIGANQWFNDFTNSASLSPVAAEYPSIGTANGLTGNTLPGNGRSTGANPFTNMFFSNGAAVPTGVTASWNAGTQDSFDDRDLISNRQQQLFGGYLQRNFEGQATSAITLTLAGLDLVNSGKTYDLYVYIDGEDGKQPLGQTGNWDATIVGSGSTYYGLDNSDFFSNAGRTGTNTYAQVTSTNAGARQAGNYVLFSGLSGDGFTFRISSDTHGVVLNAWEVVLAGPVPVPAPLALLTLGLAALGLTRRRRPAA